MRKIALTLTAAAFVAACQEGSQIATDLDREVGTYGDQTAFGSAVAINSAINEGEDSYRVSLARRFAEEVDTTVNFAFNSAVLDAEARAALDIQADFIRQFPEVRFTVYGHTDLVGSASYNRSLGLRRAQAVVNYLVGSGVDRSRLEAVVTLGETQPLVVTEGMERANRRTVTEVSGFLQRHPTVLNGRYAEIIFRDYVESARVERTNQGISGDELSTEN